MEWPPNSIPAAESLAIFKKRLKTHLFHLHFDPLRLCSHCFTLLSYGVNRFSKKSWALFKTPVSFSAAQSVFSIWKKFNFSEKNALRQALLWELTNDKWVASRFLNNKKKEKIATDRTSFGAQGVVWNRASSSRSSWTKLLEAPYSFHNVALPQTSLWTDMPSPLTSKPDISAAHSTRLQLQLLL